MMSLKPILRSLLQKTIRRGYCDLTEKVLFALAEQNDSEWVFSRAGVLIFEECWPAAAFLEGAYKNPTQFLIKEAKSIKNKDAAGLGSLAYEFLQNKQHVLSFTPNEKDLRIVAAGVKRPYDFFKWAEEKSLCEPQQLALIYAAKHYYPKASWPWDKAFIIAGAYLATKGKDWSFQLAENTLQIEFPLWVAIDKHTPEGKNALNKIARKLSVPPITLQYANFYCEGVKTNAMTDSIWWNAEIDWRLNSLELTLQEMTELWGLAKPLFRDEVGPTAEKVKALLKNM